MYKIFSFILLFTFTSLVTRANDSVGHIVIKDLKWEWLRWDFETDKLVTYHDASGSNSILFDLDLVKYQDLKLRIEMPAQYFLWIDSVQVFSTNMKQILLVDLDSLWSLYSKQNVRLSVYSAIFDSDQLQTHLVKSQKIEVKRKTRREWLLRSSSKRRNVYILVSIFSLAIIIFYRTTNYRLFSEYFSISSSLRLRQNFDLIIANAPLSLQCLGFIFLYALLVSASLVNFSLFLSSNINIVDGSEELSNLFSLGLNSIIICLVLMLGKVLLVSFTSELFKLQKAKGVHFYAYFRHSLLIVLVVFFISILNGMTNGKLVSYGGSYFETVIVFVWMFRLVIMYLILNKVYAFRKFHLFSYLCSTELIPLLLFLNYFLK